MKQTKKTKKPAVKSFTGLFKDSAVKWYDWVILFALMLFCFLSFNMRDLPHTSGCSFAYLNGHFASFYEALAEFGIDEHGEPGLFAAYFPTLYVIFAVWNIPMRVFGVVKGMTSQLNIVALMWAKLLPCLFYFACGFLVFRLCLELKMHERKAKLVMFAFLSMPVAFIGQFVLGNYESILLFFCLMGILAWFKKKDLWFVFWFSLAFTCKYTAILLFFPLLLLRQKNIWKLILMLAGVFVVAGLEFLIYRGSPAFRANVFGVGTTQEVETVTGYIFHSVVNIGFTWDNKEIPVYLTVVSFAFTAAYAYFKHCKDETEEGRYAMYILCLAVACFFCLSKWHPQWLLLGIPFWTITAALHKDTHIFFFLDLVLGVLFVMFMVQHFQGICDQVMLQQGVWKYLMQNRAVNPNIHMSMLIGKLDMALEITMITAILAVYSVFKHPKYMPEDAALSIDKTMIWLRIRTLLPLLFFILPAMYCMIKSISW